MNRDGERANSEQQQLHAIASVFVYNGCVHCALVVRATGVFHTIELFVCVNDSNLNLWPYQNIRYFDCLDECTSQVVHTSFVNWENCNCYQWVIWVLFVSFMHFILPRQYNAQTPPHNTHHNSTLSLAHSLARKIGHISFYFHRRFTIKMLAFLQCKLWNAINPCNHRILHGTWSVKINIGFGFETDE